MTDSTSLDSRAVLGLLAKAHEMFSSESTFLSFPIGTPLAYTTAELLAAMAPAPDAAAHAKLAEFSTLMNIIPQGLLWPPSAAVGLDDVVRDIVGADWAVADRTPEEEARFEAARSLVDLNNPVMAEYMGLKDAWMRAKERFAKDPLDPAALESEQRNHTALLSFPAREQIEQALRDLIALDERAPHRTHDAYEQRIAHGYGSFDDPLVGLYAPVRLLPASVLTAPSWDSVTLDRATLDKLAEGAPAPLRARLAPDSSADDTIERIAFEYTSVMLHRSWFEQRLFDLRCWRFTDPAKRLSDGQQPSAGECGAYVCAIVLARNVAVSSRARSAPPEQGASTSPIASRFLTAKAASLGGASVSLPRRKPPGQDPRPVALIDREQLRAGKADRELPGRAQFASPAREFRKAADSERRAPRAISEAFDADARALGKIRGIEPLFWQPPPISPPQPQEGVEVETTPPGTIVVLALICKTVPLSPNPSPDCKWP